jgi:hypothetical protein
MSIYWLYMPMLLHLLVTDRSEIRHFLQNKIGSLSKCISDGLRRTEYVHFVILNFCLKSSRSLFMDLVGMMSLW